jgi:gliding motility-associated-like protein
MRTGIILFTTLLLFYCTYGQSGKLATGASHGNHSGAFFENKGQWPSGILFKTQLEGGNIWVQQKKLVFHLQDFSQLHDAHFEGKSNGVPILKETVVHLNFIGSNDISLSEKDNALPYYYNYFLGKDSSKWASEVHGFQEIKLRNLYDGIDLKLSTSNSLTKYEFIVKPMVDPTLIRINYAGQEKIKIDRNGNLILLTSLGKIIEKKPLAYQVKDGKRVEINCVYEQKDTMIYYKLGKYDASLELVIDPVLVFATYNGAISDNFGMTATYGYDGTAYSGGIVYGNNYPLPNPNAYDVSSNFTAVSGNYGITDVFISKYTANGTTMLWSTFLGGGNSVNGTETAHSLICDSTNNIYVFGATSSIDFPTTIGAYQPSHNGGNPGADFLYNGVYFLNQGTDIFISKLSANGQNLLGSTFVGGSANDGVNYSISGLPYNGSFLYDSLTTNYGDQFRGEIILDASNNVLIGSCTRSADFPVLNAFQPVKSGGQDAVVFKLAANFSNLLFSSFYGGTLNDACYSIKIDTLNNVLFAGGSSSSNLPGTAGGLTPNYQGGKSDGFVAKIASNGSSIMNATYLGKFDYDQAFFVEIDRNNNVFVLGQSLSGTFPVINAPYSNPNSSQFVIKLNNNLTTNLASTVIGNGNGTINISPAAFLVDICGNVYISGWGANILQNVPLGGMPISPNAFQPFTTGFDFYLMVLERDFLGLLYGSYIGGPNATEHVDGGTSRFDKNGVVYQSVCGGCGGNSDFPTSNGAWSSTNNSTNCNNLLFKFDFQLIPNAAFSTSTNIGCEDFTVSFFNFSTLQDNYLWDFGNNDTSSTVFNPVITYTEGGVYNVFLYVTDSVCSLTDTAQITITVLDSISFSLFDSINLCSNLPYILSVSPNGLSNSVIWSLNSNLSNPLNNPLDSSIIVTNPGMYYVEVGNALCSRLDSIFVNFNVPITAVFLPSVVGGCAPITVDFDNSSTITSNFYWDFGNGVVDSVNYNPSITYTQPGTYTVSLIIFDTSCAGVDSSSFTINVSPSISVSLADVMNICTSNPISLVPTVSGSANYFIWSSNNQFSDTLNANVLDTTLFLIDPQPGYYYFQAGNNDCSIMDSVLIGIFSNELNLTASNTLCLGDSLLASVINTGQELFTYEWSPLPIILNPSNSSQVYVQPLTSQYIYVEATSANNCVVNDSVFVNVFYLDPSSVLASAQPTLVVPGSQVLLSGLPGGMVSYSWTPIAGLNTPTLQNTFATVQQTTIFTLTVSDGVCFVSDTTEVKVYEIICDHPYVFVPNAFSPNGDGNNDILFVRGLWVEKVIFRIFDRWGELVFESDQVANGWDGTFQGRKLDPDVYDYYLDVTCIGGLKSISKGNVTLMK